MKTVQRAYAVSTFGSVRRVLVDNRGFVFYPGNAWMASPHPNHALKVLPGVLPYNNWFDGWWEKNWQTCPEWVWCYGMAPIGVVR